MTAPIRPATIRPATPSDVDALVGLVHELAAYERAPQECQLRSDQLAGALFGDRPALFAHVAEVGGRVVGCAIWFVNFSTWTGRHGVYLEDLFVTPDHRGDGLGRGLLHALAQVCLARGYARLEWSVLDWNESAIGFYRSLGAYPMSDWTVFRLTGEALAGFGAHQPV